MFYGTVPCIFDYSSAAAPPSLPQHQLTTCGMACKAAMGPSREDGLLVKVLRAHGAIPFARGNVGQCM